MSSVIKMKDTICVEVDGIEYGSTGLEREEIGGGGWDVDATEYTARLEDFPECFGTGETAEKVRENFGIAIRRELGSSEELAAQKLVIGIQQASGRFDKTDGEEVKRKTIGVRAKKNGDVFAGRVPVGAKIIIMPASELEAGNKGIGDLFTCDRLKRSGIQETVVEDWNIDELRNVLGAVSKAVGSLMKIVELRQRIGKAVIEVIVRPMFSKGRKKTLTTDADGNLDGYVYVTTKRKNIGPIGYKG